MSDPREKPHVPITVTPGEFLWSEIPSEYRTALPGDSDFHREYDDAILAARKQQDERK